MEEFMKRRLERSPPTRMMAGIASSQHDEVILRHPAQYLLPREHSISGCCIFGVESGACSVQR
jgi:hypothetical protein